MNGQRRICVDASVAVKWVIPEENSEEALSLYEHAIGGDTEVIAPPHLGVEVANAIWRKVVRRLLTYAEGLAALVALQGFRVDIVIPPGLLEEAMRIAHESRRPTVYDTVYVAAARAMECELWTADETLVNALSGTAPWVKSLADYHNP